MPGEGTCDQCDPKFCRCSHATSVHELEEFRFTDGAARGMERITWRWKCGGTVDVGMAKWPCSCKDLQPQEEVSDGEAGTSEG